MGGFDAQSWQCATCSESFPSRNKLFAHLKQLGHETGAGPARECPRPDQGSANRCNADLDAYYKVQNVAASAEAWADVYERLRSTLPVCFRVGLQSKELALRFLRAAGVSFEPAAYHGPLCSLWTLVDAGANGGLEACQDLGLLYRQEQNSALPAQLLGVKEHHLVLDMCASPGSKTLQLLELMRLDAGPGHLPSGILVANDTSRERASVLARRTRQQGRQCLLITCSDATVYPTLRRRAGYKLKFDRILCDVPCSSDGTLRKDRSQRGDRTSLWPSWTVKTGLRLHTTQLKCLRRGLQLLAPGGRLLYSTCSLNPVENEAVVAAALADWRSAEVPVRLVPVSGATGFSYTRGCRSWGVPDRNFRADAPTIYMSKHEAAQTTTCDGVRVFAATLFPPDDDAILDQLPHCARLFPTHGNGGGFFIALFEKADRHHRTRECTMNLATHLDNTNVAHVDQPSIPQSPISLAESGVEGLNFYHREVAKVEARGDDRWCGKDEHAGGYEIESGAATENTQPLRHSEDWREPGYQDFNGSAHMPQEVNGYSRDDGVSSEVRSASSLCAKPVRSGSGAAEYRPLFKAVPPCVAETLIKEFDIRVMETELTDDFAFPVADLRLRGDNLILASRTLSKVWSTAKGLQVLEQGQYIASGVRQSFETWRFYPEAASLLGCVARRRRFFVGLGGLQLLVSQEEGARPEELGRASGWPGSACALTDASLTGAVLIGLVPAVAVDDPPGEKGRRGLTAGLCVLDPVAHLLGEMRGGALRLEHAMRAPAARWLTILSTLAAQAGTTSV